MHGLKERDTYDEPEMNLDDEQYLTDELVQMELNRSRASYFNAISHTKNSEISKSQFALSEASTNKKDQSNQFHLTASILGVKDTNQIRSFITPKGAMSKKQIVFHTNSYSGGKVDSENIAPQSTDRDRGNEAVVTPFKAQGSPRLRRLQFTSQMMGNSRESNPLYECLIEKSEEPQIIRVSPILIQQCEDGLFEGESEEFKPRDCCGIAKVKCMLI